MLDGQVDILDDLGLVGDDLNELVGDHVRVQVVEADPFDPFNGAQLGQQVSQGRTAVQVQAVAGDVLSHHDELLHAGLGQVPGLFQDGLLGAAAELAPDVGDDAVGAAVVAALGDAQPGPVIGGADHTVGLRDGGVDVAKVGDGLAGLDAVNDLTDLLITPHADEAIHVGAETCHLVLLPLGHAAGDDDLLDLTGLLHLHQLFDFAHGLVPGLLKEAAGVHHHGVAVLRPQGHLVTGLVGLPDHLLAVDLILGTAKGNKSNFHVFLLSHRSGS